MSHSTTKSIQIIQLQNPFRPFNCKIYSDQSTTKSLQTIQLQNPFRPFNYKIHSDHSTTKSIQTFNYKILSDLSTTKSTRDNQQLNPSRLTCSLTHYLPPLFIPSLTLSLPCSFGVSLTCTVAHYLTIPLAPLLAPSLNHSLTHALTYSLMHLHTHSCTHVLTHLCTHLCVFLHLFMHYYTFMHSLSCQSPSHHNKVEQYNNCLQRSMHFCVQYSSIHVTEICAKFV